jgi:hypothetical protein
MACKRVALSLLLLFLTAGATSGLAFQLTRGFISGVVTDPSGGVIVGARVFLTDTATNEGRQMATNQAGVFRFVAVEPGTYRVEFTAPGFETTRIPAVRVGPAEEVVLNETLRIEVGAQVVEVRDTAPATDLSRASPTVETTLHSSWLRELPLQSASRNPIHLARLAPTVARGPGFDGISANGQRTRQNDFLIDGTDNNDLTVTVAATRIVPEAVAELQIQAPAYSAEYGRNSGAQISLLTPRGSNELHGELWEYYSANWLESVSLPNKRAQRSDGIADSRLATPRFVENQAGARLGGPIKKERTFFLGLLDANRRRDPRNAKNSQSAVIPTPAGYARLAGVRLAPGQTLASRQAVLSALSFLPELYQSGIEFENVAEQDISGTPIQMGSVTIPLSNSFDFWSGLLRVDHRFTDADSLTYRYLLDKRFQPDAAGNRQLGSRFAAASAVFAQNHALSYIRTLSPNLVNQSRFAYIRVNQDMPENDPITPTVQIGGAFNFGGASNFPQGRISNTFQWQNITSYLRGRHAPRFGVDIRRIRVFNLATFDAKGTWFFSNFSQFLDNQASLARQVVSDATFDARHTFQAYFFQDDFRVTRELNLNLGLRYEYSSVPFGFFGATDPQIASAGVPGPAQPDKNNWAPRFGFAFSPSASRGWMARLLGEQKTVLRGGFGIAYDVLFFNLLTVTAMNYPRVIRFDVRAPATDDLFPALPPKDTSIPPFNPLSQFVNVPSDIQHPTTHFWSFTVQRQLASNSLLEFGYAGSRSYHQLRQGERNPALLTEAQAQSVLAGDSIPSVQQRRLNSAWGSRASVEADALAEYHAGFVRFDHRLSETSFVGGNYTWSATFSNNDEALGIGDIVLSSPPVPQDYFDLRNDWSRSAFDRPHRLVLYYAYHFPTPSLANALGALGKNLLGGWEISGSSEWQSGQPFTVRTGVDSGGSGVPGSVAGWRPDLHPAGVFHNDPVEGNLRTFRTPLDGSGLFLTPLNRNLANTMPRGGNLGRNTFRGPAYSDWNLSIAKSFAVSERVGLRFRADFFNLWNHRNFGNPDSNMNSLAFGANSTDPGSRKIVLGGKLSF